MWVRLCQGRRFFYRRNTHQLWFDQWSLDCPFAYGLDDWMGTFGMVARFMFRRSLGLPHSQLPLLPVSLARTVFCFCLAGNKGMVRGLTR